MPVSLGQGVGARGAKRLGGRAFAEFCSARQELSASNGSGPGDSSESVPPCGKPSMIAWSEKVDEMDRESSTVFSQPTKPSLGDG